MFRCFIRQQGCTVFGGLYNTTPLTAVGLVSQVILNTAPDVTGATHWGQLTFQLHPPIDAYPGDSLLGEIEMVRQAQNPRLYNVSLKLTHESPHGSSTTSHVFKID